MKGYTGHRSHASIYTQIREGLFTKAVPIGARSVGWVSNEVEAIVAARIAGKTDHEIRALVRELHARRLQPTSVTAVASRVATDVQTVGEVA